MFQPEKEDTIDSKFILIKIISFDTLQNMFKVEYIDQQDSNKKSYCFYLNLYNQKFFFKDSIKGSKLFKQAEDSGWQLDLKH